MAETVAGKRGAAIDDQAGAKASRDFALLVSQPDEGDVEGQ